MAAEVTTTTACLVDAMQRYVNTTATVGATATSDNPVAVGLGSTALAIGFPEEVQVRLYELGYHTAGFNGVGLSAALTITATNTAEGEQTVSTSSFIGVTIDDPDGVKGTGDEHATTTPIVLMLPATMWTATGGEVAFRQGKVLLTTTHFFGSATVRHDCRPGSSPDGSTLVPTIAEPFAAIVPPAPPTCSDGSFVAGRLRAVEIDVASLCGDPNDDLDASTVAVVRPPAGGTTEVGPTGAVTYTNTDPEVGTDSFEVTITDREGRVSAPATITVDVQYLRFMQQADDSVVLPEVSLDGGPNVSSSELSPITVTNESDSGLGFTVSVYAVDLGAPGSPTSGLDLDDDGQADLEITDCDALGGSARACIPSGNLGWVPRAHIVDADDPATASITAGEASAASAAAWLAQLSGVAEPVLGLDAPRVLCSSDAASGTGVFECGAELFLAVPATAAATTYTGFVVVTIL